MHTICFNLDVSLACRPPVSLLSNYESNPFDEMFERSLLLISSPKRCCTCCCCYYDTNNSTCNRLTAINPSFLCSQSTLIQSSLTKRLIFYGSSRGFYGNTTGVSSLTHRNNYHEKLSFFNERRNHRQRGFGHKRKKQFLGNVSDDYVNDVEVMLSLLTNEVDLDHIGVKNRKKIDKKHIICDNKEKKNVGSEVVNKDLKYDDEQVTILEKKDSVKGYGKSVGASQDWRKKSEKKLIDEFSQHQSNVSVNLDDLSGTCTSSLSESRMKNCEEIAIEVKDMNEEKHMKMDHSIKITNFSSEKSQQISRISDTHVTNSENSSVSHRRTSSLEMKMVEETKDGGLSHSSHRSGPKGPSDEMWHVTDASDDISSSSENGDAVKNNGRSLLTIIGDVIRFRWSSPCPESHIPNSGGGKCSSCLSVSSKAWFLSHENDSIACNQESPIPFPGTKKSTSHPHVMSLSDSKNGVLKRRKPKDKFDEWEEAYSFEGKKRKEDEMFMREALLEAKKAADVCEVPVGAVLVHGGKIIARGYNLVEKLRDSTAHAEMICIREASKNLRSWRLLDTTLYVTLEPCPMCAGAILQARIDTVVWGAPNKLLGADGSWIRLFSDGNEGQDATPTDKPPAPVHPFHQNMTVRRGVLASECAEVMQHFFRLRRTKKAKAESLIPTESESSIPVELESRIPTSSTTVSHDHSSFLSKVQQAFKIIFCL